MLELLVLLLELVLKELLVLLLKLVFLELLVLLLELVFLSCWFCCWSWFARAVGFAAGVGVS